MDRILAAIDASSYAGSVLALCEWAAPRLHATVELLHVIQRASAAQGHQDLSGAIGLGEKSGLLEELTRLDEAEGKVAIERGRLLLQGAADRLRQSGVPVETLARHGGIVETIVEREADAALVIIGKRGASHEFASDHIGSKVERVARASDKPVLIASREVRRPSTVVIAFDNSDAACRAVRYVATSPLFADLPVQLVMAGSDDDRHRDQLGAAANSLPNGAETILRDGKVDAVIGGHMADRRDAVLVMGAYGHSPLRTLIVGSTTTAMIRTFHAPVLLVR
ncbi:universal stress protein [Sphingomonas molluscorum]|uniref:universal stress protein n=1 Tax=Sphingomonas molluscorum TaxID=418184 RepID=UPI0031D326A5